MHYQFPESCMPKSVCTNKMHVYFTGTVSCIADTCTQELKLGQGEPSLTHRARYGQGGRQLSVTDHSIDRTIATIGDSKRNHFSRKLLQEGKKY